MIFPNIFFDKEIRNDFEIAEMMKRAWAAAIEVLEVIDSICKKNKLTWYADWGTLLGTIRHNGFIPWDDDIDISMLRQDYDTLIKILPEELPQGFSLAGMYATDKRLQDAAKVQQLRVIADEKYWNIASYMSRFHGFPCFRIGIDIFPLDYVYRDNTKDNYVTNIYFKMINILTNWEAYFKRGDFDELIKSIGNDIGENILVDDNIYNTLWKLSDEIISKIPEEQADHVTNYFFRCYYNVNKKVDYIINKRAYSKVISKPFEFFEMPVPEGYDVVLKAEYGNYMEFVKSYDTHNYPFYKVQLEEFEKMLRDSNINTPVEDFCRNWMNVNY